MKLKYFLTLMIMALTVAFAQAADNDKDVYRLDETSFDFGTIKASDGRVEHTYTVTNISDQPIVITTVTNGGCGCTKPKWTKAPIAPGKTGEITINFNPQGRKGEFNREVRARIETATQKHTAKIRFSGVIVP